jgi:hypothetical protein
MRTRRFARDGIEEEYLLELKTGRLEAGPSFFVSRGTHVSQIDKRYRHLCATSIIASARELTSKIGGISQVAKFEAAGLMLIAGAGRQLPVYP